MSKQDIPRYVPPVYQQLQVRYDPDRRAVWYSLAPKGRPCFNMDLLRELRHFQDHLELACQQAAVNGDTLPVKYMVLTSEVPGVFNLGGDLELFTRLIREGNGKGLQRYATACIDVLYPNAINLSLIHI